MSSWAGGVLPDQVPEARERYGPLGVRFAEDGTVSCTGSTVGERVRQLESYCKARGFDIG